MEGLDSLDFFYIDKTDKSEMNDSPLSQTLNNSMSSLNSESQIVNSLHSLSNSSDSFNADVFADDQFKSPMQMPVPLQVS